MSTHAGGLTGANRPRSLQGEPLQQAAVVLPLALVEWARRAGEGDLSAGLRRLLEELAQWHVAASAGVPPGKTDDAVPAHPVRVLVVDGQAVVRRGLARLFATVPGLAVVGEAGSVADAIEQARQCQPNVVLMEVRLPDGSGVEACRAIRADRPDTQIVMLTGEDDEAAVVDSILAGAAGYFLKQIDPDQLVDAVVSVSRGGSLLDGAAAERVRQRLRQVSAHDQDGPLDPLGSLSAQERKILPLIADGMTNRQIAATLHLSDHTVKTYVGNILHKLKLSGRAEVAAFYTRARPALS
jgi:two-component system, NarL family, response regulator DevR